MREPWQPPLLDRLRDAPTLALLWLLDLIAGPEPMTPEDHIRAARREKLRRLFPDLNVDGIHGRRRRLKGERRPQPGTIRPLSPAGNRSRPWEAETDGRGD